MTTLTTTLAFRVPTSIKDQIEKLAKDSQRKKSDILLNWITEKLELESWQIEETNKAIAEADAGVFATDDEVDRFYKKWAI